MLTSWARAQTRQHRPTTVSCFVFLQATAPAGLRVGFAGCTQAFCQSNPLRRPGGPLYAQACHGTALPEHALLELLVPLYGLIDAPVGWRPTLCESLRQDDLTEPYVPVSLDPWRRRQRDLSDTC